MKAKVSKNVRNWNKLVGWYRQGDNWVKSSYDYCFDVWRESQMPWEFNRFSAKKYPEGIGYEVEALNEWLENNEPTARLIESGVVIYK